MSFDLPEMLVFSGAWFATMSGVWALFDRISKVLKEKSRRTFATYLLRPNGSSRATTLATYAKLSDRVFGRRIWSLKSFVVSTALSLFSITVVTLLWRALRPVEFREFTQSWGIQMSFVGVFGIPLLVNLLPDYISLLQTRTLLRRMGPTATATRVVAFLAADFLLTSMLIITVRQLLYAFAKPADTIALSEFFLRALTLRPLDDRSGQISLGMFVYSTYVTSIWIWLFALSGCLTRAGLLRSSILRRMADVFDIQEQPIRFLGFVGMLVVTIFYLVILIA